MRTPEIAPLHRAGLALAWALGITLVAPDLLAQAGEPAAPPGEAPAAPPGEAPAAEDKPPDEADPPEDAEGPAAPAADAPAEDAAPAKDAKPEEGAPKEPKTVPLERPAVEPEFRVLPGILKVDARAGGSFRGWSTSSYPGIDLSTTTYITWSASLRAELFDLVRIHKVSYESNGLVSPRPKSSEYAQTAEDVQKVAWLLGMLGVPFVRWPDAEGYFRQFEVYARYEARAFESNVKPDEPIRFVPYDTKRKPSNYDQIDESRRTLHLTTTLETLSAGIAVSPRAFDTGKLPLRSLVEAYFASLGAYIGAMGVRYTKPYMVHLGNDFDDGYLYDARFEGIGGMFGFWMGPRDKWPYFETMVSFGGGRVRLTQNLDIEDRLGVKGTVTSLMYAGRAGYRYPILERAPRLVIGANGSIDGATFFLQTEDEGGKATCDGNCPKLNTDLFWSAALELTLAL